MRIENYTQSIKQLSKNGNEVQLKVLPWKNAFPEFFHAQRKKH